MFPPFTAAVVRFLVARALTFARAFVVLPFVAMAWAPFSPPTFVGPTLLPAPAPHKDVRWCGLIPHGAPQRGHGRIGSGRPFASLQRGGSMRGGYTGGARRTALAAC